MKFSFEFDAPKYNCFGIKEPQKSTNTKLDEKSAQGKWFMNFNDRSSWGDFFTNFAEQQPIPKKYIQTKQPQTDNPNSKREEKKQSDVRPKNNPKVNSVPSKKEEHKENQNNMDKAVPQNKPTHKIVANKSNIPLKNQISLKEKDFTKDAVLIKPIVPQIIEKKNDKVDLQKNQQLKQSQKRNQLIEEKNKNGINLFTSSNNSMNNSILNNVSVFSKNKTIIQEPERMNKPPLTKINLQQINEIQKNDKAQPKDQEKPRQAQMKNNQQKDKNQNKINQSSIQNNSNINLISNPNHYLSKQLAQIKKPKPIKQQEFINPFIPQKKENQIKDVVSLKNQIKIKPPLEINNNFIKQNNKNEIIQASSLNHSINSSKSIKSDIPLRNQMLIKPKYPIKNSPSIIKNNVVKKQPQMRQIPISKNQLGINKQIPLQRQISNVQNLQMKKPFNYFGGSQQIKPSSSHHYLSKKDNKSKDHKPISSLDSKFQNANKKQNLQLKHSKSQIMMRSQPSIKRNIPCLYPIRIQRQWQEVHGKKWYQLSSRQMVEAEKSMKRRMNQRNNIHSNVQSNRNEDINRNNLLKMDNKYNPMVTKIKNNNGQNSMHRPIQSSQWSNARSNNFPNRH